MRRVAAGALRNIAEGAYAESGAADVRTAMQSVLPTLAGALADSDWHVYVAARDALSRVGQPAVSQLINAMSIGDDRVSYTAAEGLAKIGLKAVPQLLRTITESPDSDVARWAAIALGDGPSAGRLAAQCTAAHGGHAAHRRAGLLPPPWRAHVRRAGGGV